MKQVVSGFGVALLVLSCSIASAQRADNIVRLPPSVGATPIEIPGAGRESATPIEIPGKNRGEIIATLPTPIPGPGVEQFNPRRNPEWFSALPLPIPDPRYVEKAGRFSYAVLPDGTVYGDTEFGYSRFDSVQTYRRFLESH